MECLVRPQGLEITLKILLPALEGFALLLSKLLNAPRGAWKAEESSSGWRPRTVLSFAAEATKRSRVRSAQVQLLSEKDQTKAHDLYGGDTQLQEVPGYPGFASRLTKTQDVYTKCNPPTTNPFSPSADPREHNSLLDGSGKAV